MILAQFIMILGGVIRPLEKYGQLLTKDKTCACIFGFNRLSIQDLSKNAHQPMLNSRRDSVLLFNGEIYNTNKLRNYIEDYSFRGTSDTEVIFALCEKYGFHHTVKLLNGMFALVYFDAKRGKIYFARDRIGIKPLYFFDSDGAIIFSSEIKSIIQSGYYRPDYNKDVLYELFNFRSVIGGETLFHKIRMFEPGKIFQYNIVSDNWVSEKYYELRTCYDSHKSYKEYKSTIYNTLLDSVKRQMISDVKVGTQLSGGIDSSLVSFMVKEAGYKAQSVSICFENNLFSEEMFVDKASHIAKTVSHKYIFSQNDFYRLFEKSIYHMESILTHPNCMGLMKLCEEARNDVTVLLSGEGADELFGGYEQFISVFKKNKTEIPGEFIYKYALNEEVMSVLPDVLKIDLSDKIFQKRQDLVNSLKGSALEKQIQYELLTYLPELLVRQDKMSMANSIENRVPILDNDMIDAALSSPDSGIIRSVITRRLKKGIVGKFVLKDIAMDIFGRKFAYRSKMGFAMPIREYMADEVFKKYYKSKIKGSMRKRGIISEQFITDLLEDISNISMQFVEIIWKAVNFEVWCQLFIDGRKYCDIRE